MTERIDAQVRAQDVGRPGRQPPPTVRDGQQKAASLLDRLERQLLAAESRMAQRAIDSVAGERESPTA